MADNGKTSRDNALIKFDKSAGKSLLKVLLEASSHGLTQEDQRFFVSQRWRQREVPKE